MVGEHKGVLALNVVDTMARRRRVRSDRTQRVLEMTSVRTQLLQAVNGLSFHFNQADICWHRACVQHACSLT